MHLLVDGIIQVGERKGPGVILITQRSAFFLLTRKDAAAPGLLAFLLAQFFARKKVEMNLPAYMSDPEIAELDEKTRRRLLTEELGMKLALEDGTSVQETRMGYRFENSANAAEILSWGNKKRIARALSERGIVASPRR